MNQNTLEKTFRNWSDGKRKFISSHNTWERFSSFCKEYITDNQDFSSTHLHVGFWLAKNWESPIRLPAILIPALETMRTLLQNGIIPPTFVIYQATSIISQINNIGKENTLEWVNTMENTIYRFIKENFPDLIWYIDIYFWEKANDWNTFELIQNYSWHVSETLEKNGNNSHFQKCEQKHSNWNNNYNLYVTANTLYNWGFDEYPFENIDNPQNIIPIWWRSETKFFETLLETQTSVRNIFPLITQVGAFPTYYKNPKWDISTLQELWEYNSWNISLHPDIQKDLQILYPYSL